MSPSRRRRHAKGPARARVRLGPQAAWALTSWALASWSLASWALALGVAASLPALAQAPGPAPLGSAQPTPDRLPENLTGVGFDQRLGEAVPLDLPFRDEEGRAVTLGSFFGERPVVLVPAYYECPMLCSLVLEGLAGSLAGAGLDLGREVEVVTVSFDPRDTPETARAKKESTLRRLGRPEAAPGWHFLSGEPAAIRGFTEAVGFRYREDPATGEFSHTAGVVVATAQGRISRYFFGLEPPGRDLRLAVVEAGAGRVGSLADHLLLFCFRYDPATGRYSALTLRVVRLAGAGTVLGLAAAILLAVARERRRGRTSPGTA